MRQRADAAVLRAAPEPLRARDGQAARGPAHREAVVAGEVREAARHAEVEGPLGYAEAAAVRDSRVGRARRVLSAQPELPCGRLAFGAQHDQRPFPAMRTRHVR